MQILKIYALLMMKITGEIFPTCENILPKNTLSMWEGENMLFVVAIGGRTCYFLLQRTK